MRKLFEEFFSCDGKISIEELELKAPTEDEHDRILVQNNIVKCLELLANAGSTTHRVEHVGSMLCLSQGMEGEL